MASKCSASDTVPLTSLYPVATVFLFPILIFSPAKQFITEEKMAAHLSGLHISSDYTAHTSSDDVMEVMDSTPIIPSTSSESSSLFSKKLKGHTIVLSEELKMIKDEPLIPAALIERYV